MLDKGKTSRVRDKVKGARMLAFSNLGKDVDLFYFIRCFEGGALRACSTLICLCRSPAVLSLAYNIPVQALANNSGLMVGVVGFKPLIRANLLKWTRLLALLTP